MAYSEVIGDAQLKAKYGGLAMKSQSSKPTKCKACKKPLSIKFAVEVAGGYMHQSCFRKAI